MNQPGNILATIVDTVVPQMQSLDLSSVSIKPDPDRWSKIEILGHLLDSANNNHRRFVLACFTDELIFDGYDQEAWVRVQDYQNAEWSSLVSLWRLYNKHLASLIEGIDADVLQKHRARHCLHRIAWKPVPENEPATLDYFIRDYIGHLEHHVGQILPDYQPVMMGTYEYAAT